MNTLLNLLDPKGVVFLGTIATSTEGRLLRANLRNSSREVRLYVVSSTILSDASDMEDRILSLKDKVEMAVISPQDPRILEFLEYSISASFPNILLFSREHNVHPFAEEITKLVQRAQKSGVNVVGPTSAGLIFTETGFNLSPFQVDNDRQVNRTALIYEDSARIDLIFEEFSRFGLGFGMLVPIENLPEESALPRELIALIKNTDYIDSVVWVSRNASKQHMQQFSATDFGKPVIFFDDNSGVNRIGMDEAYRENEIQNSASIDPKSAPNCTVARNIYEISDFTRVLTAAKKIRGNKTTIVTTSTSADRIAAEYLRKKTFGMPIKVLPAGKSTVKIVEKSPDFRLTDHGIIASPGTRSENFKKVLISMLEEPGPDNILILLSTESMDLAFQIRDAVNMTERTKLIFLSLSGPSDYVPVLNEIAVEGIVFFPSIRRAVASLKCLARVREKSRLRTKVAG